MLHSITVDAAVRAGIVLADVSGGIAGAFFAITLLLGLVEDEVSSDTFEAFRIDAPRLLDKPVIRKAFWYTPYASLLFVSVFRRDENVRWSKFSIINREFSFNCEG